MSDPGKMARYLSVHRETRPDEPRRLLAGGLAEQWVAVIGCEDGGGYRIPGLSERSCWLGVWKLEGAGIVIPDAVLDKAAR